MVTIAGMEGEFHASKGALDLPDVADNGIVPLSPFDSLIWTRSRQLALFGKDYKLESYKKPHLREFGYFALPLLRGSDLIGRIAVRKKASVLHVEAVQTDTPLSADALDVLIRKLIEWSEAKEVEVHFS
jgi:uncharacterized protein YcaQ